MRVATIASVVLAAATAWPGGAAATEARGGADPDAVFARAGAWLQGAPALVGRFEQRLVSGALGADAVESGRVWIRRPGTMRWDYDEPDRKVALLRDGRTLLYLEEDAQVIRGSLDASGGPLADLLAGDRPLGELFAALPPSPDDPEPPKGADAVRLRPRDADGAFESVTLTVRRRDGAVLGARVRDSGGNVMDYRFPELERRPRLPDEVFSFTPPPGTEILDER